MDLRYTSTGMVAGITGTTWPVTFSVHAIYKTQGLTMLRYVENVWFILQIL